MTPDQSRHDEDWDDAAMLQPSEQTAAIVLWSAVLALVIVAVAVWWD